MAAEAAPGEAGPGLTFEVDIAPILQARCHKCHGGQGVSKANLDLRRRGTMLAGGDSGAAIVPGKPDESLLVQMVESDQMPPAEEGALDARQKSLLRQWVAGGAALKDADEPPLEETGEAGTVTEEDRQFWSFRPPVRTAVPTVQAADRVRTPIDTFLLAKLESQGLSFNPDAPRETLIRRLYFDLWGLPPAPEEIDAFLADGRPDAYERLVQRLLDSPRYGERWARHWLDVAGYADSDGYLEADRERPEAWRYRDYVIRALNDDKPYDRFVLEQLAGDELADWRAADELTPELIDNLVATGFLRTASDPTYPGYAEPLECHKVMADTVQIVSTAFLGLTLQCARCHSHKFDPISQRDYYRLNAVLVSSYDPARWLVSSERGVPLASEPQRARLDAHNTAVDARLAQLAAAIQEHSTRHRGKLIDERLAAAALEGQVLDEATRALVREALLVADPAQRTPEQAALVQQHAPQITATDEELAARFPDYRADLERLNAAAAAELALKKPVVVARGLMDLDTPPAQAHVLVRGDHARPGMPVDPGVPEVLAPVGFELTPQPGSKTTGRRRAFAEWLVTADHPLTARVHVNRVWAHHFGRGIVETVEDLGRTGKLPSHPELLDWLSREFVDTGWSQKRLHRLIVTSTAYRQTSDFDAAKAAVDPDNVLLWAWPPQRHEGEAVRDALLAVAGRLNLEMYGPPVPVAQQGDGSVVTADDPQGNRRSIYLKVRRSQPLTMLEQFDTPRMEINCPRRTEAITATQALALLNSPMVESAAAAAAQRIVAAAANRDARIEYAYKLLLARSPTEGERHLLHEFFEQSLAATLGERAAAATVEERAAVESELWRHATLALMNANEFLYVH
jgi:hypothetical protein